jgi:SSS family solute:Na+ symporter
MSVVLAVFTHWDWGVLGGYLVLMAGIGFWASRKKTDAEGYFLAERRMPTFAVALSIIATSLSIATFVGVPQAAFKGDLTYLSLNMGGFLAVIIVGTLFIPKLYRAGTVTIYGYIEQRFGDGSRIATSSMFLLGRFLASGVRLFFAAIPVSLLIYQNDPNPLSRSHLIVSICLIGAIGTAYTVSGGIRAVIWTDSIQIIIVFGAALLSIGLVLHEIPLPIGKLISKLAEPGTGVDGHSKLRIFDTSWSLTAEFTIWTALIGNTFMNVAAYGVDHDMVQRMLTAKSPMKGSISLIVSQLLGMVVVSLFLVLGLLLYVYYKRPDIMGGLPTDALGGSERVYPQFLLRHVPTGLAGLAMAGMFAAAQGSLDSAINAMASSAVADLYWPLRERMGRPVDRSSSGTPRLVVLITGAVLIAFAVASAWRYDPKNDTLLVFALGVMPFAYTGMLGVFLTALLTRRGNTASVLLALATGLLVTVMLQDAILPRWTGLLGHPLKMSYLWWMPIGTVASFLVCIAGKKRISAGSRAGT